MNYVRMPIEIESPEQIGYGNVKYNLTESSMSDARLGDLDLHLNDLVLCYGDHVGHRGMRTLIAEGYNQSSGGMPPGAQITANDVLITAGAATALFIVATTLLERGDNLVVMRPNYATNIETPRALGADITFFDLRFEEGWQLDVERLAQAITPRTRLVSLTTPHNPTGTRLSEEALQKIIALVESRGCYLLLDETYRELLFAGTHALPSAATLSRRAITVSSLSKAYGLPGIRLGWLVTRDNALQEKFLAAKEQIMVCNSVVDEEIGFRFLQKKESYLAAVQKKIESHFAILCDWMEKQSDLEWVRPVGGVVCFPRIKASDGSAHIDIERFYRILNETHGTFVGPGHWFEMERRYLRIGYGWPTERELTQGLANISLALNEARRS